jgi:hypothetical protein
MEKYNKMRKEINEMKTKRTIQESMKQKLGYLKRKTPLSNTKVTKRKGERTKLIELEMIKQLSPKT